MKKKYVKPSIMMEKFNLAQHVAGCGASDKTNQFGEPNIWSKATCSWTVPSGVVVFTNKDAGCKFLTEEFEGVCYNAPTPANSVFGS